MKTLKYILIIDNASCEVLLAEKTYPSSSEKMKKKASIEAE